MERKPLVWLGDSLEKLRAFPARVRRDIGFALDFAQAGDRHGDAKPLKGFGGAGVLAVIEDFDGNTYRAVYTVKLAGMVYVLHVFQKKTKRGIATAQTDLGLIKERLKQAREHHRRASQRGK